MARKAVFAAFLSLTSAMAAAGANLVVDGTTRTIDTDTRVRGSVVVENGGTLRLRGATLTLALDFDEQFHVDVSGDSRLIVDNGVITSTGGQYWIELTADDSDSPTMEVHGDASRITNHAGIRPFDATTVTVTGGDVEELQVRDQVRVDLSDAAVYPVFFFDGATASIDDLGTGPSVSQRVEVPGGWSFRFTRARVEEYQIDLENGADVVLDGGEGIVASLHTPGNLGDELRIVEGVTADRRIDGEIANLGNRFRFTDTAVTMLNVYTQGTDRVLLRDLRVNEVNASGTSQLVVGQQGHPTRVNCNLCQVYDSAGLTLVGATIDARDNQPSATASPSDVEDVGRGTMSFSDMDLRQLDLAAVERGTFDLRHCQSTPSRIDVVDSSALVRQRALAADFTPVRRRGPAPLEVAFVDLSGGAESWTWDFGDGTSSTEREPVHVYTEPGAFDVRLTVHGGGGVSSVTHAGEIVVTGDASCGAAEDTLCLTAGRFQVRAFWKTAARQGSGRAVLLTDRTGYFWFFDPTNVEVVIKVLDGCDENGRFWVFAAGLTDVFTELTVLDTETGDRRVYRNPAGTPFQPLLDTAAFETCP